MNIKKERDRLKKNGDLNLMIRFTNSRLVNEAFI
jgi:hypothetical protein